MAIEPSDIREIFVSAMDKETPEAQAEFLDEACKGNVKLHARVEALLRSHTAGDDFLSSPALGCEIMCDEDRDPEPVGTVIDRYKLVEKIGEGGMAVVYMAEQQEPFRRKVALKIIKLGMDTKQVIARFEAERQALAMMDHPNIAKVLDAGATETGRPYFVMELVTGMAITAYCDRNGLSMAERLDLFVRVCDAVQHAHQKGIIHRDIKPSNVMVAHQNGERVPKIIDFGIAKATNQRLTEKTLFTRYAHIIGTPAYMSPEQAEMNDLDVDTRSDIYSLGVLLYELLTGTPPFSHEELRKSGYCEMQRIIREQMPSKPSTKLSTLGEMLIDVAQNRRTQVMALPKLVRGDLDWIVMKALEKERTRRYASASALGEDVRRHQRHEPIWAGPPGLWYRSRKFVERHVRLVAGLCVLTVTVFAGLIISMTLYFRAESAIGRMDAALLEAERTADFLANDLLATVYPENAKNSEVTVRYILGRASAGVAERFAESPVSEARIREILGLTYQKMGDFEQATPHLERALEIRLTHLDAEDPDTLSSMNNLGHLYWQKGQYEEAEPLLTGALRTRTRILGEEHPDTLESLCYTAWLNLMWADWDKGVRLISKTVDIASRVLGEEHPITLKALMGLALVQATPFPASRAEPLVTKGYETSARVLGAKHETTLYFTNLLVWMHRAQRRYEIAEDLGTKTLATCRAVFGEKHPTTMFALSNLGWLYIPQGRYAEANELLARSVDLSKEHLGERHGFTVWFLMRLGVLYHKMGRHEECKELMRKSLEQSLKERGGGSPLNSIFRYWIGQAEEAIESSGNE